MAYWLVKTEPHKWSWTDQVKASSTEWDGVRNYQASNNMKAMKIGDKAFFYHSGDTEIVGIVEICKEYYPDDTDPSGRFGMVDVKTDKALPRPVTLQEIKSSPALQDMRLIRQSRLSVSPVTEEKWAAVMEMAEN